MSASDNYPDLCTSRTIKPKRKFKPSDRPVIAVGTLEVGTDEHGFPITALHAINETTGTVVHVNQPELMSGGETVQPFVEQIYTLPRSLVVTTDAEHLLFLCHQRWSAHPLWHWKVTEIQNPRTGPMVKRSVGYFGFRAPGKRKEAGRFHLVLDPTGIVGDDNALASLLELGIEVREFCNEHELELRSSLASIAGQLLRHPRFYPDARRRVPGFINEMARPHLPGGHNERGYADVGQRIEAATLIDQEAAHHYAAMTTPLPNANSVVAMGYYNVGSACTKDKCSCNGEDWPWSRPGRPLFDKVLAMHGLLRARVIVPPMTDTYWNIKEGKAVRGTRSFVPGFMQETGEKVAHLWTNEVAYLQEMGLEILYLSAAWGTAEVDKGIAAYARWAYEIVKQHPHLKPMLHSVYGMLGKHANNVTMRFPHGDAQMVLGRQLLEDTVAKEVRTQATTANVLQLGLIQSFVRAQSLDMARLLDAQGHTIISIYADGIFIKTTNGKQLPMFAPWRVKEDHLDLELGASLRVPVKRRITRDYISAKVVDTKEDKQDG